ncbi:MAG: aspartyl protease family protein [Planctomycetaceae bacterium]|nr:aspartyl protease family protein [Planctomycetaceae bacterium]
MAESMIFEIIEDDTVGRFTTSVRVENLRDLWDAERGELPDEKVRRIEIKETLVDTGSTLFSLPTRYIKQLGLNKSRDRTVTTTNGIRTAPIYDAVRLTIMDRVCTVEVMEVPDNVPALVGQIPLEVLDLVVNPLAGTLTGNPAHGGEHVLELL